MKASEKLQSSIIKKAQLHVDIAEISIYFYLTNFFSKWMIHDSAESNDFRALSKKNVIKIFASY
ncbi:hypothetical protein BpHYR1_012894 [Brachionus plicatilis]|uniref:Uncharacterized protein n=1 Tax=Brachionus plicatilis TaxID=10195 RepID=A0A3M7PLL5_BRAPC|nr:hypothetical protein BpHYR1_012894 [Brachionus plicatilis]